MTRDRQPSPTVFQKAYGVLDRFRISRSFFVKTDQEGCAVAASDINAANGITSTSTVVEATGVDQKTGKDASELTKEVPVPVPALILNSKEKATEEQTQPAKS